MPGAFQLDVFLVVLVSCVVVKLVHVSHRIDFISSFSSWSHVASGLWAPLLVHKLPQNFVMSFFEGGSEISFDLQLGVCSLVKNVFLLVRYCLLFYFWCV